MHCTTLLRVYPHVFLQTQLTYQVFHNFIKLGTFLSYGRVEAIFKNLESILEVAPQQRAWPLALLVTTTSKRRPQHRNKYLCASVHEPADTPARDSLLAALCPAKLFCRDAPCISLPCLSPHHRTADPRLLLPRHHSEKKKSVFQSKVCDFGMT